jgi:hypothetical protein
LEEVRCVHQSRTLRQRKPVRQISIYRLFYE